jgi:hypothetical protein
VPGILSVTFAEPKFFVMLAAAFVGDAALLGSWIPSPFVLAGPPQEDHVTPNGSGLNVGLPLGPLEPSVVVLLLAITPPLISTETTRFDVNGEVKFPVEAKAAVTEIIRPRTTAKAVNPLRIFDIRPSLKNKDVSLSATGKLTINAALPHLPALPFRSDILDRLRNESQPVGPLL